MKISVPQRKNLSVNDLVFENQNCHIEFVNIESGSIEMTMTVTQFGNLYEVTEYGVDIPSINKLMSKTFEGLNTEEDFNSIFYNLQKRLKSAIKVKEGAEVTKELFEAIKENRLPNLPVKAEIKEAQQVVIKLERPQAVGLEGQIQDLVYNCLESEYTVQAIQNKMVQLGLEPNITEIVVKQENKEPRNVGTQHREFETILQTISAGVNLALVGPAGSGKTTCVHHVAEALSLPFYSKSVSAQTGVHEFFGYQDANGNYVRTLFREAYENGGVFLLDEFDAGNPNVLASMNQATANGSCAFADGMVQKHSDFVVVMAGNTYGHGATSEYVGRNQIDKATLDRFAFIYFDYDESFELALSTNKDWTKEVQAIRKKVCEKRVKTIVSPRASFDGAKLLAKGMKKELVKQLLIYKGLTQDEVNLIK